MNSSLKAFEEHETVGAVFALPQFIDENGAVITEVNNVFVNSVKKRTKYEWMNYFFLENCVCYPTSLVKREYYERAGFFRLVYRSLPDFEMWVRLFYCCEVLVLDKELMSFRVHQFNESGKNLGNIIRCQTEHKQILKTLLAQIGSLNELKQIFPGCKSIMRVDDARLIPFYFAQILLEQKKKLYRDLAFDILYDELQKEEIYALVVDNNLYDCVELSRQVAESDVFGVEQQLVKVKPLISFFGFNILDRVKTGEYKRVRFLYLPIYTKAIPKY